MQLQSEQRFESLKLIFPQFTVIHQAHSSGLTYSRLQHKNYQQEDGTGKVQKEKNNEYELKGNCDSE